MNSKLIERARTLRLKQTFSYEAPTEVVLKMTTACNLRCVYCYTDSASNREDIEISTIEKLFDQIGESNSNSINCIFHGGEPLLCVDSIVKCIELISKKYYANRIRFYIQTNGTLLNESIIDLIKKYNIHIGLSLDGLAEFNDKTRIYPNGRGSFNDIYRAIKLLQKHNIKFGIISVITENNIRSIIEYLEWCSVNKIHNIKLVTRLPIGRSRDGFETLVNEYINIYRDMIEWLICHNSQRSADERIYVREIESFIFNILSPELTPYYCMRIPCSAGWKHISMDVNGNIYACDCLLGQEEFKLGNISKTNIYQMTNSAIVKKLRHRNIRCIEECDRCEISNICYGGCPAQDYLEGKGWHERTVLCDWIKKITLFLEDKLNNNLDPHLLCASHDRLNKILGKDDNNEVC
jgi:radical SAM protein with 4Fe4S-binding SPASM domain